MTQKKFGKDGHIRSTLADIAREMAKPRMTESVRNAAVVAPAPEVQGTNKICRKVIRGDVTKSSEQPSERHLDEGALSRMDDDGGGTRASAPESVMSVGDSVGTPSAELPPRFSPAK